MLCMKSMVRGAGVGLAFVFCAATLADDLSPPPWRGQALSVRAEWEFLNPPSDFYFIPPEFFQTVPGAPQYTLYSGFPTHAEVDLPASWAWTPADADGGLTPAPGVGYASIGFKVQNWVDDLPEKQLRVQIAWIGPVRPTILGVVGDGISFPGQLVGSGSGGPNHYFEDWVIHPNPSWELLSIGVTGGTTLDQVVIDTVSLPGPATLVLAGAGALAISSRRRRG